MERFLAFLTAEKTVHQIFTKKMQELRLIVKEKLTCSFFFLFWRFRVADFLDGHDIQ